MRNIQLQQKEILSEYFSCSNAKEVFEEIRKQHLGQEYIVCGLRINGTEIDEQSEVNLSEYSVSDIHEFCVDYCKQEEFVEEFAETSKKILSDIIRAFDVMSDQIAGGKYTEFHVLFKDCIDALESFATASLFLQEQFFDEKQKAEYIALENDLALHLNELFNAYESKDFVELADIIEYELKKTLSSIYRLIQV